MFSDVFLLGVLVLCLAISDIFKTTKIHELEDDLEGMRDEVVSITKQVENHLNKINERVSNLEKGDK